MSFGRALTLWVLIAEAEHTQQPLMQGTTVSSSPRSASVPGKPSPERSRRRKSDSRGSVQFSRLTAASLRLSRSATVTSTLLWWVFLMIGGLLRSLANHRSTATRTRSPTVSRMPASSARTSGSPRSYGTTRTAPSSSRLTSTRPCRS